jgi:HK97 family phage portal protein
MALWDRVAQFLALENAPAARELQPVLQVRAIDSFVDHPGLTEQLMAVQGLTPRPWRVAGHREALGVPAIFRAVTLIANVTGSLTLRAFRQGAELPDTDRPRLIVRPNPFTTSREFFRMTAYCMASRGEAWWWVAARDSDDVALSLIPVNPAEVSVEENVKDLRYPIIRWRGRLMPNADMIQIPFMLEPGSLRGVGPLQVCGAAISVAVESQEWAANYFAAGGRASTLVKSAVPLSNDEAAAFKADWVSVPNNMPRVIDPGIDSVTEVDGNPQGAQMLEARNHQNSDVARMFGIPGSLLEAAVEGSSITYQNVASEFDKFVRACLLPDYLEPIEQSMSDLLTRATVSRFNTDALLRADVKTRYDVYGIAVDKGILTIEEIRAKEGLEPGDVENAPVPLSLPQAIPASLPIQQRSREEVRCDGRRVLHGRLQPCNKLLSQTGSYIGKCPRCQKVYPSLDAVA